MMNLKEGTRRLALLLGVVGAIVGGFASYAELQSVLSQRARHVEFEQLAKSAAVQQELNTRRLKPQVQRVPPTFQGPDGHTYQFSDGTDRTAAIAYFKKNGIKGSSTVQPVPENPSQPAEPTDWEVVDPKTLKPIKKKVYLDDNGNPIPDVAETAQGTEGDPIQEFMALPRDQQLSTLQQLSPEKQDRLLAAVKWRRKDGISTILWTKDNGVESIETDDGQTFYPTPAPAGRTYLLIAFFPIIGFFIPWGAVRAIGWVGTGFVAERK